jgi:hypothetical protein
LPKSQVDAQTILEAVAVLIAAHNDDPDAHLEEGQALQSHKASEIIDHLAYSVVRDKITFDRFSIDCDFQSLDAWEVTGDTVLDKVNVMIVAGAYGANNIGTAQLLCSDFIDGQAYFSKSPNWQARVFINDASQCTLPFGLFNDGYTYGMGFEVLSGHLNAVYFDADNTKHTEFLFDPAGNDSRIYRIEYDHATTTIRWLINGALVHSISTFNDDVSNIFSYFYNKNTYADAALIAVSNVHYDADNL